MKNTKYVSYLFRFMTLFNINRFEIIDENKNTIQAIVGFPDDGLDDYDKDEETQEIQWVIQCFSNLNDVMNVVDMLRDNDLIFGDKIKINDNELIHKCCDLFNWEIDRAKIALDNFLDIKIDMIDDGEKTDYFFVHF